MDRVLLIEDERTIAAALQHMLEVERFEVVVVSGAAEGIAAATTGDFQVVITDWKMPGSEDGMDVVKNLRTAKPHLPVILITGQHTTEAAIEAMKFGAYDYVVKPPEMGQFLGLIRKAAANSRLMSEPVELEKAKLEKDAIIGSSLAMQEVYKQIGRIAATPVTVLIRGETGTGKELVARAVCQHSDRAGQPFIEVNCVAIPENLLESELFGHEPGAFTGAKMRRIGRFEQANKGTILLDEIGDMTPSTQAKLLRVLQNQQIQRLGGKDNIQVDVRVIAATHLNLELAIQEKRFREDLYYRLNQFVITLPPLRERKQDMHDTVIKKKGDGPDKSIGLVNYFIQRYAAELRLPCPELIDQAVAGRETSHEETNRAEEVFEELEQYSWPGNVRELRNVVRKAILLARGYPITREIIKSAMAQTAPPRPAGDQTLAAYVSELLTKAKAGEIENVQNALTEAVERELYTQAIQMANGDQTKAASWVGVARPTMKEKLLKFGLHPSQAPAAP